MRQHLNNCVNLHESRGSWKEFLKSCDLNAVHMGFSWYMYSNCHYIVTPSGVVHDYYGFNGHAVWQYILEDKFIELLKIARKHHNMIRYILQKTS